MTPIAGVRITGQARVEMATAAAHRYLAGESIRAIAVVLGRSYGFVQQLLVELEVPLRSRGGDTRSPAARARLEGSAQRVAELVASPPPDETSPKKSKGKKKAAKPDQPKPDQPKASKPEASKPDKGSKKSTPTPVKAPGKKSADTDEATARTKKTKKKSAAAPVKRKKSKGKKKDD